MKKLRIILLILATISQVSTATNCTIVNDITECSLSVFKRKQPISTTSYTQTVKLLPVLSEIPPRTFRLLPEITTLIVNYTMAEKLYNNSFDGLSKLQYLDLFWNQIDDLPIDIFQPCPHLVYLNLGGNNFQHVNGETFRNLQELKILILSWNRFSSIPDLSNLHNLQTLDLSKNQISHITGNPFKQLKDLLRLNLKSNQIDRVPGSIFVGLKDLQFLNLERNVLIEINVDEVLENLPKLKQININANRFSCEILKKLIDDFTTRNVYIPEGLAEDELIHRHGIFCLPKTSIDINNDGL